MTAPPVWKKNSMVTIDNTRCAYCGGCVSVFPVEALTLNETRLEVDESCIECGDCIPACPVGALSLDRSAGPLSQSTPPRRREYDLVVIGAGPGGSIAARTAAQAGLSVLLLEKRQEIGSPVRCAEGIGHEQLTPFIEPDPRWIAAAIRRAEITVMDSSEPSTIRLDGGNGYVLERRVFDRTLSAEAAQAGAEVKVKTPATGLVFEDNRVCGVRLRDTLDKAGRELEVGARVVIAADGVEAQAGRWAGLDLTLAAADTMVCVQYLLAGIRIDPACNSFIISPQLAPGGYTWVFPKGENQANVGIGVQAGLLTGPETAMSCLNRFIESTPNLARGSAVTLIVGNVPVARTPDRLATGGLMVVGDAVRQVDPLNGGGIANAMTAGKLAAETAIVAIAQNDTSAQFLARYRQAWQKSTGRLMERNYRLRMKFPPERRVEDRFVQAFSLAVAG